MCRASRSAMPHQPLHRLVMVQAQLLRLVLAPALILAPVLVLTTMLEQVQVQVQVRVLVRVRGVEGWRAASVGPCWAQTSMTGPPKSLIMLKVAIIHHGAAELPHQRRRYLLTSAAPRVDLQRTASRYAMELMAVGTCTRLAILHTFVTMCVMCQACLPAPHAHSWLCRAGAERQPTGCRLGRSGRWVPCRTGSS